MPPFDPTAPLGDVEDIRGAFEIEVMGRFDEIGAGSWQRLFDLGDGPNSNNILLTQYENTNDLTFVLYQDGMSYRVTAPEAIVEGETAAWNVGIDESGLMWIDKDGARLAEAQSSVPIDMPRATSFWHNPTGSMTRLWKGRFWALTSPMPETPSTAVL